jgi:hypothetical protein
MTELTGGKADDIMCVAGKLRKFSPAQDKGKPIGIIGTPITSILFMFANCLLTDASETFRCVAGDLIISFIMYVTIVGAFCFWDPYNGIDPTLELLISHFNL